MASTARYEATKEMELRFYGRLVKRLRPHSPVRLAAEQLLAGGAVSDVEPLIEALPDTARRSWRERCVAAWSLGKVNLTAAEREAAVGALRQTLTQKSGGIGYAIWRTFLLAALVAIGFLAALAWYFGIYTLVNEMYIWLPWSCVAFLMVGVTIAPLYVTYLSGLRDFHTREAAAVALGRLDATEAIGELAAASFESTTVGDAVVTALHHLLPLLKTEQYGTFLNKSIIALGRVAAFHPDTALSLQALEALEKIGTPAAIPFVERAAEQYYVEGMRETAARVMAVLREREAASRVADRLVRPATAPAEDTLLRAAGGGTETPPEKLLRASDQEKSSD